MICGRQYSEPFTTLYLIAAEIKSIYSNFKLTVIYFVALYHCKFQNPATKGTIKKRKYVTANEISGTLEY